MPENTSEMGNRSLGGMVSEARPGRRAGPALRSMRPHHAAKNLLLAVPLLASRQWQDPGMFPPLVTAMACFSLVASAMYIWNDLFDLKKDRLHPVKCRRPLAGGELGAADAVGLAAVLLASGLLLAAFLLPLQFLLLLMGYALATLAYSWRFKAFPILDLLFLAAFYTLRVYAGGAALGVVISTWLAAFSAFFFLSLAAVKRYREITRSGGDGPGLIDGRPYAPLDSDLFRIMGIASGLLAVLVLALYINGPTVRTLYGRPEALLLICPVALYWILRVWLLTLRGRMDDDPLLFAIRDRASYGAAALTLIVIGLAS